MLLIGHSDQQTLGRWTDLKIYSAMSVWCWEIQSVAGERHQPPNIPATCFGSQPGLNTLSLVKKKQLWTALSLWLSQVASREEAFCTFAWTHWQTKSNWRLLSVVGDFSPSLSSLFTTVLVVDCLSKSFRWPLKLYELMNLSEAEYHWIAQWQICWTSISPSPPGSRYF